MKHKIYYHLGLNTKVEPQFLKEGECSIAQDCYFDKYGNVSSRKFKTVKQAYPDTIRTIFPYSNLFVSANGSLYNGPKLIGSGYGTVPFNCVEYNSVLHMVNNLKQLRWNGTDLFNLGLKKPDQAPTISDSGDAGNLDGEYYYKITYEDKYGLESNPSGASNAITVATNKIDVGFLPTNVDRITHINIYRLGGTLTKWYFVDRVYKQAGLDSASLARIDTDDQGSYYRRVWGDGSFIYVASGLSGIRVHTVSDIGVLTYVGVTAPIYITNAVRGDSNFLYVADASGLRSYGVDNTGTLTLLDTDTTPDACGDVFADDDFIYVAGGDGLYVYSVDAGGILTLLDSELPPYSYAVTVGKVWSDSRFVYVTTGSPGLFVYSVDSVGKLTLVDSLDLSAGSMTSMWSDENYLYVSDGYYEIIVLSISDSGKIKQESTATTSTAGYYIWGDNNFIYSSTSGGIKVWVKESDGTLTYVTIDTTYTGSQYGIWGDDKFIYLAASNELASFGFSYEYEDNIADSALVDLIEAENNDPAPTNLHFLTEHYERLIGARTVDYPNGVYFTREYLPESWGDNLNYNYLLGSNDELTGIISWGRYVIIFKKHQIYVMEGENPTLWYRRRADSRKGNIAPYCLSFWKYPIFCSYDGLYHFDGNLDVELSDKIEPFFKTNKAQIPNAVGAVYDNKYYFGLNDKTLVYDLTNQIFSIYNFGLNAIVYDQRDNVLYGGSGKDLIEMEQDMNDDSETISFQIKSKAVQLTETAEGTGTLRNFYVTIDTQGEDVTLNIYIDKTLKQAITLNTAREAKVRKSFSSTLKGQYAEFEFVYSGTKQITIKPPLVINPEEKDG